MTSSYHALCEGNRSVKGQLLGKRFHGLTLSYVAQRRSKPYRKISWNLETVRSGFRFFLSLSIESNNIHTCKLSKYDFSWLSESESNTWKFEARKNWPTFRRTSSNMCTSKKFCFIIPPLQRSILVSPCPSVRLWTESCPPCILNNTHRIHFIFAHLIKQLQKVCRV